MRYRRQLVAATLGASMAFSGIATGVAPVVPAAVAQDVAPGTLATVDVDFLNVRQTPSLSGSIVTTLAYGDQVDVAAGPVAADGYDWYRLQRDGADLGWSVAGFLQSGDGGATAPVTGWAYGDRVVVTTDVLNVRAFPSSTADVLQVYSSGTAATITGDAASADGIVWYPVDNLGWVAGQYLSGSGDAGGTPGGDGTSGAGTAPAGGWVYGDLVVTTEELNVRQSPTASASVLATYASGTVATITGDATTVDGITWYPVDNLGWVAGQYLGTAGSGSPPGDGGTSGGGATGTFGYGAVVVVSTDLLNVRSAPTLNGTILDTYPAGRQATITGDPTDADGITWYAVDNTGWVSGEYLTLGSGTPDQPAGSIAPADSTAPADATPVSGAASGSGSATGSSSASTSGSARPSQAASASSSSRGRGAASAGASASAAPSSSTAASASGSAVPSAAPSSGGNTETFADGDRVVVDTARLNVRATASSTAEILRTVESGTELTINGDSVEVDGATWYNVGSDTDQEWVLGQFLRAT